MGNVEKDIGGILTTFIFNNLRRSYSKFKLVYVQAGYDKEKRKLELQDMDSFKFRDMFIHLYQFKPHRHLLKNPEDTFAIRDNPNHLGWIFIEKWNKLKTRRTVIFKAVLPYVQIKSKVIYEEGELSND